MRNLILSIAAILMMAAGAHASDSGVYFEVVLPSGNGVYKEARKVFYADSTTGDVYTDWKLKKRTVRIIARTYRVRGELRLQVTLGPRYTILNQQPQSYVVARQGLLVRDQPLKQKLSGSWYSDAYIRAVEAQPRRDTQIIIIRR